MVNVELVTRPDIRYMLQTLVGMPKNETFIEQANEVSNYTG